NVTGAAIIVAQRVVPEGQPVLGVTAIVGQQTFDQVVAFVGSLVGQKLIQLLPYRQEADGIEINAPDKNTVAHRSGRLESVRFVVRLEEPVDRIGDSQARGGNFRLARNKIDRRQLGETDAGVPRRALVNPRAQQTHLLGRQASS